MLKSILFLIIAGLAAFGTYVALQPAVGTVTRSATLAAPPDAIFAHVNELKKWEGWSPWAKIDPNAKMTYTGPAAGAGASFSWDGNREVGSGTLTITDSKPGAHVKYNLDFLKPFASTSTAEIVMKPDGTGTNVTWTMTGERPFLARAMCILFNADQMVGDMFDKGLANLGKVAGGGA